MSVIILVLHYFLVYCCYYIVLHDKMTEQLWLAGTSGYCLVQSPCSRQGQLEQIAQGNNISI